MTEVFGQVIKAARKKKGWSQRELAHVLKIDHTYVSKIEVNSVNYPPSKDLVFDLADVLLLDPKELFYLSGRIDPEDAEICCQLFKLYGDSFTKFLRKMHESPEFARTLLEANASNPSVWERSARF